jgi:hypothetical protein
MDWEQIEDKWAAMTRRVRADWVSDSADLRFIPLGRNTRPDVTPAILADGLSGIVDAARAKMSIE